LICRVKAHPAQSGKRRHLGSQTQYNENRQAYYANGMVQPIISHKVILITESAKLLSMVFVDGTLTTIFKKYGGK